MDTSLLKPKTLQQVRDAIEAVEVARGKKGLSASDKMSLQEVALKLRSMERAIIDNMEDKLISSLESDSKDLKELTEKIIKSSKKLDKLTGILQTTTKVVDAFITIVVTAVGAGLL